MSRLFTPLVRSIVACRSGSAIAEMAVVLPLMVLLLVGLIEAGRLASYTILTANAARAGVQYGSQNTVTAADATGMQNAAKADAQNDSGITATASSFCKCADGSASTCAATDCSANHRIIYVQLVVTGTWHSILSYPGMPASLRNLATTSTAVMRVAQ